MKQTDWLSPHNAAIMAARIQAYWYDAGHTMVRVWTIEGTRGSEHRVATHYIRSNLVCGMPKRGPEKPLDKIPDLPRSPLQLAPV
jgi:hypothetical protein